MIKHVVMWKFKEGEYDNMLLFRERLLALKGQIPEIRAMEVGVNINPSDRSFDAVLISEFDSLDALKRIAKIRCTLRYPTSASRYARSR